MKVNKQTYPAVADYETQLTAIRVYDGSSIQFVFAECSDYETNWPLTLYHQYNVSKITQIAIDYDRHDSMLVGLMFKSDKQVLV